METKELLIIQLKRRKSNLKSIRDELDTLNEKSRAIRENIKNTNKEEKIISDLVFSAELLLELDYKMSEKDISLI